jgi:hypothetical protein
LLPILKDEMDAEYSMDLKIQKSNWNQFERHYEGYYRIASGNVEDTIITYCRADKRMALIESNKDLVGLLLVLRAVCAQDNGGIKVDKEYQNLSTLHSAIGYQQKSGDSDHKFAKAVADRYGSALFTMGKFAICGTSVHEKVLDTYPTKSGTPLTFDQYMKLSGIEQISIDKLVEERTVARLIVKNSLNDKLQAHLVTVFATGNDCYPNSINDDLSLLSTFAKTKKEMAAEDAMVSYHVTTEQPDIVNYDGITIGDDDTIIDDTDYEMNSNLDIIDNDTDTNECTHGNRVSFNATVMASVISEATADADADKFLGAGFAQLQDVDDVYEDNEPNLVCCAHVVDTNATYDLDNEGDEPLFVTEANNKAEEYNERIIARRATITNESDPANDFELMIYHTAQRVLHKDSQTVGIFHYEPGRPDFISYTYGRNVPESIIDYSDELRFKFKSAGIHDNKTLMGILF